LWLQQLPIVKVNPSKKFIYSPGPSAFISKEETHSSSPEDIRPLPKTGPRKSQNVNKKRKETAILTDTPVKNAFKKNYSSCLGANEKNWAEEKRKEKRVQHL